jgi:hypothetical protein
VLVEHRLTLVEMPRLLTDPYYRDTLHLVMAHQHRGQLGDNLQGVLENAQVRVIFGVGRQTARGVVEELFRPETTPTARTERETLAEEWKRFTQRAQRLGHR